MPKLVCHLEGKKTVIDNIAAVALALSRPPSYISTFFGQKLGAHSNLKDARATLNGPFTADKLQSTLDSFIKILVNCAHCGGPETLIRVDPGDVICLECMSCGHVTTVDPREKMCSFIAKNPPTAASLSSAAKTYIKIKARQSEVVAMASSSSASSNKNKSKNEKQVEESEDDDEDWSQDSSPEAAARRREAMFGSVNLSSKFA